MVMPRTETMPAYTHIELDEVHTPSRYFALLSFLSWEVHCAFTAFGFFLLRFTPCLFLSCLSTQQNNRPPAASSEASLDRLATPQDAEDCHRWTRLKDDAPWMLHAPPEKPDFARTLESQEMPVHGLLPPEPGSDSTESWDRTANGSRTLMVASNKTFSSSHTLVRAHQLSIARNFVPDRTVLLVSPPGFLFFFSCLGRCPGVALFLSLFQQSCNTRRKDSR